MVTKGVKTAADAARLFKVHPATVSRLLARTSSRRVTRAK
jgi:DNA-binding LacI/PurR family transcriptional regulator